MSSKIYCFLVTPCDNITLSQFHPSLCGSPNPWRLCLCTEVFSMPYKPKKPCAHTGCRELTHGRFCPAHQKLADQQYEKYQRDPDTKNRYGRAWQRVRRKFVAEHPLCEECLRKGEHTPVQEVHHILPRSKGGTHAPDNSMSLCSSCHSTITAKEGGRWG